MNRPTETANETPGPEMPSCPLPPPCGSADRGWLSAVWLLSIVYMSFFVFRGWIPSDEGLLGQTAERVLAGELPHRDFDDCYTGGLALLYAAAFQVLGTKLTSIRLGFFLATALVVPAIFSLARRAASPGAAALGTLLCVAWSVPNNFAGMPSWYVLFLSIAGVWTLFRFFDSGRGRWLVAAGLCGGLALVVKITGLYFIAAAGLALVYHEQRQTRTNYGPGSPRSPAMLVLVTVLAGGLAGCVLLLLRHMWRPTEFVYFFLPTVAVGAVLISHEWNVARGPAGKRLRTWAFRFALLGLGVAAPVACFLVPYLFRGGLMELYRGLFVLPAHRFEFSTHPMPRLLTFVPVILWAVPLGLVSRLAAAPRTARAAALRWLLTILPCAVLLWACRSPLVYDVIWCSMLNALPVVAVAGCGVVLLKQRRSEGETARLERLFLLLLAALLISFQQFPFAVAIYFCYGAPLLILAALHVLAVFPRESRRFGLCLGAFYLAFAVLWMNPAFNVRFSGGYSPDARLAELPRSGLHVRQSDAQQYESVVKLIQQNSPPGSCILALPDCPEIYFLASRQNPTRRLHDFLTDARGEGNDILQLLEKQAVPLVVVNLAPSQSPPLDAALLRQIADRYPERIRLNDFVVYSQSALR